MNTPLNYFATLLEYPSDGVEEVKNIATKLIHSLEAMGPEGQLSANSVRAFSDRISLLSTETLEETYTSTFELNPVSYLYAGFLLFGESYKRGALLVELKRKLIEHGVEIGTEVPDFIPALLRLLGSSSLATSDAQELQILCLYPALCKIVEGSKNHENPYSSLLIATKDFLVTKEATL